MTTMRIRADSTEYATATITVDHDITGRTIEVALPLAGEPPSTWVEADVLDVDDNGPPNPPTEWTATYRVLIGPAGGDFVLEAVNDYAWTVRISDTPELPVLRAGVVHATAT